MTPWPYSFWIAHRGAGKLAPENTLAAFRVGASHGYRAFECDVKLSADGVPFLLHDATLERTTTAQGVAGERSWAELSALDAGSWHSPAFRGEPIPTLADIAKYCLHNGFALNIEIKPTPGTEEETGRVVAGEAARLWAGEAVKPLLSSFQPQALEAAKAAEESVPRALLIDSLWPGWLDCANALRCAAVVAHHSLLSTQVIASIHGAEMLALAYTVNDPATAQRLMEYGIDGVITDAVDRLSPSALVCG
ncbi:glycerophosphodiester phosphodiesterase [Piscinibacter sp.]|uniref:glycerophosphodiester phosphodiesterase n=1 Tax=Piscinibacter sp. TaxID=1903157 RepID=UPI002CEF2947|nr:glycerophosphodiester phosphodiesterase [Albitalea sp.]HUG22130.1 glycerophosphodiester phosphodiesterase [Albitalea sp.]